MLEWHFVIKGPKDTPYDGGRYHGKLVFPSDYPYKPPAIMMLTPNGRFATNTRLCLSMSDFHPETWVPAWSVASILNGVLSFMLEATPTVGSVEASEAERRRLALASHAWNRKVRPLLLCHTLRGARPPPSRPFAMPACPRERACLSRRAQFLAGSCRAQTAIFCELFPDLVVAAAEGDGTPEEEAAAADEAAPAARLGHPMLLLGGVAAILAAIAFASQQL